MRTMGTTTSWNTYKPYAYSCNMLGFVRPEISLHFALIADLQQADGGKENMARRKLGGVG